jgi:hypothetical protein
VVSAEGMAALLRCDAFSAPRPQKRLASIFPSKLSKNGAENSKRIARRCAARTAFENGEGRCLLQEAGGGG